MKKGKVLCSISTRGRYDNYLPMALQSVMMQTRVPDYLVIFDDNDEPTDLRNVPTYQHLFQMLYLRKLNWEVIFGEKKGQHYNHHKANHMGYEWVWRVDDDNIAEPNVLETFMSHAKDHVGAIGGAVLTPPLNGKVMPVTGKIENISNEPNVQWNYIRAVQHVDHLHCSFLYRAGVQDYELSLSKVAHREETLFTYGLKKKGYDVLVVPNAVTWHLKSPTGGIRDGQHELYMHDERLFELRDYTIVVLDSGLGDHINFKHMLPEIKNPLIFSCYPDVFPGVPQKSIAEALELFSGNIDHHNVYRWMDNRNWKGTLEEAYRAMYLPKK